MSSNNGFEVEDRDQVIDEDGESRAPSSGAIVEGTLIFEPPSDLTPGYLRRERVLIAYSNAWQTNKMTPELYEELLEILLAQVTEPADRDEARAALEDLPRGQVRRIVALLLAGGENQEIPLSKSRRSSLGSKGGAKSRQRGRR